MFALKNKKTGKFLALNVSGNGDADYCGSYTASLEESNGFNSIIWYTASLEESNGFNSIIWVTSSKQDAERVARENIEWFNSELERPMYKQCFDIEVVELTTK